MPMLGVMRERQRKRRASDSFLRAAEDITAASSTVALSLSVPLILAAQTAGGAIGSAFAPAKVIVGASTVPGADEGDVLRRVTIGGLTIIMALGVVVWLATYFWLPAAG